MSTSVVVIDGVLRKLVGGAPIPEGVRLFRSLLSTGRVVLLGDVEPGGPAQILDWLELNGCTGHDFVDYALGQTHLYMLNRLRRQGYDIDLVVEPDPRMAQEIIKGGYNTLLYTHSQYAHPSWRPDAAKGVQPWGEIVDLTAKLARLKAADERLRGEDG